MLSIASGEVALVMGGGGNRKEPFAGTQNGKEANNNDPLTILTNIVNQVGYTLANCYTKPLDVKGETVADIQDGILATSGLMPEVMNFSDLGIDATKSRLDTLEALTDLDAGQLEGLMADVDASIVGSRDLQMTHAVELMETLGVQDITPEEARMVVDSIVHTVDEALLMKPGTGHGNTASTASGSGASGTPSTPPSGNSPNNRNNGRRRIPRIPAIVTEKIRKAGCLPQLIGIFLLIVVAYKAVPPILNVGGSFLNTLSNITTAGGENYQFFWGNKRSNPTLHDVNWNGILSIPNSPESQVIQAGLSLTVNDLLTSYQERGEYNRDVVNSIPRALAESTVATADGLLVPGMSYNDATRLAAVVQDGLNRQNDPQGYPDRREKFLDTIRGETPEQTQALRDTTGRMLDFIIDNADEYSLVQTDPSLFPPYGLIAQTDNAWLNKEFEMLRSKLRDIYGLEKLIFNEESRVPIGYAIVKEGGIERYVDIHDFDAFWEEFSGDRRKNVISVT